MSRKILLFAALAAASTCAVAQIAAPGPAKSVKVAPPVMVVPVAPVATVPKVNLGAERTIELLKNAGVVNPTNIDRPISLTAHAPYIDDTTFLMITAGDYAPGRNMMIVRGPELGVTSSFLSVWWNPMPDKRYVIDCSTQTDGADLNFRWSGAVRGDTTVQVASGRAGVVLPANVRPPVIISASRTANFNECNVTPFSG